MMAQRSAGSAAHVRLNIAEGISKELSGAVFGAILIIIIFLVPHGARQVAYGAEQLIGKLRKS